MSGAARGVFDKAVTSMERLRRAGVFFGISLTATRHNAEEIFTEDFIDYFFEQQGALYGWIFQYMPIGRSYTLDLIQAAKTGPAKRQAIRDHCILDLVEYRRIGNKIPLRKQQMCDMCESPMRAIHSLGRLSAPFDRQGILPLESSNGCWN